jgi:signal transduction histidine kinase
MFKIEQRISPFAGLRGMNERVRQLGGERNLSSSDKGMAVRAIIPTADLHASPHVSTNETQEISPTNSS